MSEAGFIRPHQSKLDAAYKFSDAGVIILVYTLIQLAYGRVWHEKDVLMVLMAGIVYFIVASALGMYRSWRTYSIKSEICHIALAWFISVFALMLIGFGSGDMVSYIAAEYTVFWLLLTPMMLSSWHVAIRIALRTLRSCGFNTRTVAIVGYNPLGQKMSRTLATSWMGLKMAGFYDDRLDGQRINAPDCGVVKGDTTDLLALARADEVDMVCIALPFKAEQRIGELIAQFADTPSAIYMAQDYESYQLLHGQMVMMGGVPVVSIFESPFNGVDGWVKRTEDIVLASIIATVISMPCLIIALSIKLTSSGPVIFKQKRYGLNGNEIEVWKFRSMYTCDNGAVVKQATKNDSRVTPLGRFLRRTSLDELPQFLNVLQGHMSIVGPRPHAVAHNEKYRQIVDSYMLRHKVMPGITGWAQVNGLRGETDSLDKMERRVEFDLDYIRQWSISLDLKIILLTFFKGFTDNNAY